MRTIILYLLSLIFLTSCDSSVEEPMKMVTPNTSKLLISKIYYNGQELSNFKIEYKTLN